MMELESGDIILCINDEGYGNRYLTRGIQYRVETSNKANKQFVRITDNEGRSRLYYSHRFVFVERSYNPMSKQEDPLMHVVPSIETPNPNLKVGQRLTIDEKRYYELIRAEKVLNRLWVCIRNELGLSEVPWASQNKINEDTIRLRTLEIIMEKIKTFSEEEMSNP